MNILISSAGRQAYLVTAFKEAINSKGLVFVADNNKNAPTLNLADGYFISPLYESKEYLPWILNICKTHRIDLLITLNVDELLILELQREKFKKIGCSLVGGKIDIIKTTSDKYALTSFANKIGLHTPKTFLLNDLSIKPNIDYPLIVKPRYGKGSRGQFIIKTHKDYNSFIDNITKNNSRTDEYILQQFINGDEFGLDVVNDLNSHYAATFVRKKHLMKNGETYEATTVSPNNWVEVAQVISENVKHQGTIDIDFIIQNDKKYLIDINHRFGGGYIFSHFAGANLPKAMINWLLDECVNTKWLEPKPNLQIQRNDLYVKRVL
jgi:carbamoyl-phosphate synthase large subunit